MQYTTRDWRSRNRVISNGQPQWLSVPAGSNTKRLINEVALTEHGWQQTHWSTIRHGYNRAPYFRDYAEFFERIYLGTKWESLSAMNQAITIGIARELLGIQTEFRDAAEFQAVGSKTDRLVDLCVKAGATHYLSGPAARTYIKPERFQEAGVQLEYKDYSGYPEYPQQSDSFEHAVSILDLIFNVGPAAPDYIWGWRQGSIRTPDA